MQIKNLKIRLIVSIVLLIMLTFFFQLPSSVGAASVVRTDKDIYNQGEMIKVNFSNSPGNEGDWICIVAAGSPVVEAGDYKYMPKGLRRGFLIFDPPPPGKYEARVYYNYKRNGYVVSGRYAFSVVSSPVGGILSPPEQAGKATRDDYVLFQSVTLGDKNKQMTGFSTSGSLAVLKTPNGNMVDYELWTRSIHYPNSNQEKKESVHGPVRFSRNPTSEEVSFSTKGFGLAEDVINQIMTQVEKNPRVEGTWDQEISLKLLGAHLPQKLAFHFDVQKVELKPGVQALLIRTYTDVFTIEILPTAANVNNGVFSGMYKCVLIYSPEDHRLYQTASSFDAGKGDETMQIQETAFLVGLDGKPVFPLIDMRKALDLNQQDKPNPLVAMPLWAVQALKVHEVVSFASATTAERASNDAIFACILSEILTVDGTAGLFKISPSDKLIEAYAATNGTPAGQLATRFLGNVVLAGVGEMLPESLLLAPVLPAVLTAVSLYTIYSNMADIGGLLLAADIGKLTPFYWCDRECSARKFAQANAAYALTPRPPQPEPGPPPEPPPAPKPSSGSSIALPLTVGVVAAAVAIGAAAGGGGGGGGSSSGGGGGTCKDSCNAHDCNYYVNLFKCGQQISPGIGYAGGLIPKCCYNTNGCPSGTHFGSNDTQSSCGPWVICVCN